MTAKGIIVGLSAVAVLGAFAAMAALSFTAAPTVAQEPTPPPPMPPTATPTLDPAAAEAIEAVIRMEGYCQDGEVYDLYATVADSGEGTGKTASLEWWSDLLYWDLPDEETLAYYRIERQSHDKDAPTGDQWETVATVHSTNLWEGPVTTGHWHYRVRLIGLVSGDLVHECQQVKWAETEVNVLTPQEKLAQNCETAYINHIGATVEPAPDGQGKTVTVDWELQFDYYQDYPPPPEGEVLITYRLERKRSTSDGSEGNWERVAEVSDTGTWSGHAEPGDWTYRVALVSLQVGDLVAQCEKPQWSHIYVSILTAEELAQEKSDRHILVEQLTTCATDALTTNLTPAAQEVVGRHIERRVAEITEDYGSHDMIPMVVMFCTETEGSLFFGDNTTFILRTLFDYDDSYW